MKLTIDNHQLQVKKGMTILDAAQKHGIYIPTFCAHSQLTPYGGCRLCIVQVKGINGFPTACTTLAEDGMVIKTKTNTLQKMRRQILQLLLSEHPSSCLICDEAKECAQYQQTIRKVGVTTGCRWCPKDGNCQLQNVTDYLGVKDLDFPTDYRGVPPEKDDPFYDRDYNLCIYCGLCVRVCDEHRKSSVLALKKRGQQTTIGTAFDVSHIEAGCEFCGDCVAVCPTGALSEKSRKWHGIPDASHKSFCPLCSLNCQLNVLTKDDTIIGTLPPGPTSSAGNLCVKGRFCLSQLVNHPDRLTVPQYCSTEGIEQITWKDAAAKISQKLKGISPDRIAMYISHTLTLEDIAAAKQFAKKVIKTDNITTSALSAGLTRLLSLATPSVAPEQIEKSDCIVSVFLNGNYNYSPITLAVKDAAGNGTPYYQIGWLKDTTSRFAADRLIPPPGKEKELFTEIVQALQNKKTASDQAKQLAKTLKQASSPVIILDTWILDLSQSCDILKEIEKIITLTGSKVFVPTSYANLTGLLSLIDLKLNEDITKLIDKGKIDALFMVGQYPFAERPNVDFIVYQNCLPAIDEALAADIILPSAICSETSGSFANNDGKIKKFKAAAKPKPQALAHKQIFARITEAMGKKNLKFTEKIPKHLTPKFPAVKTKSSKAANVSAAGKSYPYLLVRQTPPHVFGNISLAKIIDGMTQIAPEDTLIINPDDAAKLGICNCDTVTVKSADDSKQYPVILRKIISPGYVYLATSSDDSVFTANPCPVRLRKKNV